MNRDAALDRPLMMPELFHGKPSDDFEAWLQNFDISAADRWDDETRRQILLVRLRGPAQLRVLGLPAPGATLDDYAALRADPPSAISPTWTRQPAPVTECHAHLLKYMLHLI